MRFLTNDLFVSLNSDDTPCKALTITEDGSVLDSLVFYTYSPSREIFKDFVLNSYFRCLNYKAFSFYEVLLNIRNFSIILKRVPA